MIEAISPVLLFVSEKLNYDVGSINYDDFAREFFLKCNVDDAPDYSLMSYRLANTEKSVSVRLPVMVIPFWYKRNLPMAEKLT